MEDLYNPDIAAEDGKEGAGQEIAIKKADEKGGNQGLEDAGCQSRQRWDVHPYIKIRLMADKAVFGPGVQQLMELIEQTGSLQEACLNMKLSYSKGRRMIKDAERQLGFPITQRWAGGPCGGGSELTPKGKQFLKNYRDMALDVQEYTEKAFEKYFGKIGFNYEEKEGQDG